MDGGRLEQALMTVHATLDAVDREDVQPSWRLLFDYVDRLSVGWNNFG